MQFRSKIWEDYHNAMFDMYTKLQKQKEQQAQSPQKLKAESGQQSDMQTPDIPRFTLSQFIAHLQKLQDTHGDLPVEFWDFISQANDAKVTGIAKLEHLTAVQNHMVYFGGLAHVAETSWELNGTELDAGRFVYDL